MEKNAFNSFLSQVSRSLEVLYLDCVTAVDNRNRKLFSVNVRDFRFISCYPKTKSTVNGKTICTTNQCVCDYDNILK